MNYFELLKHAASLFWKTKVLWLIGILAALFGQNEYGFSVNYSERIPAASSGSSGAPFDNIIANPLVAAFLADPLPYILAAAAAALLWWLIATLIGWLAQGAMIHMVAQVDQGTPPALRTSLRASGARVWSLFLIHLLLSLPTLVVFGLAALLVIPLALALFSSATPDFEALFPRLFSTLLCLIPVFLLNGLAGIVLHVLNILAARACVLEQLSTRASIRRGWRLLRGNLGYSALNWFLLLILGALFGTIAAIPAFLLLIPAAQAFLRNDWSPFALGATVALSIYFAVMSIGVGGMLTSFNSAVWTVLYQAFQRKVDAVAVDGFAPAGSSVG